MRYLRITTLLLSVFSLLFLLKITIATASIATASIATPTATSEFVEEFPIGAAPFNIIHESAGRLWFTLPQSNSIGLLVVTSTVDFHVVIYPTPTPASQPYDLLLHNGSIWFTERTGNKLGKLDPVSGLIQEFTLPTPNSQPKGLTVGPDGMIWLVQSAVDKLASFSPTLASFVEYQYQHSGAGFEEIAAGNDVVVGNDYSIWMTAPNQDKMVFFSTIRHEFYDIPTKPFVRPVGLVLDDANLPWIVAQSTSADVPSQIGRYAPGTLSFWSWYSIVGSGDEGLAGIYHRQTATSHELWFTGNRSNSAGRLVTYLNRSPQAAEKNVFNHTGPVSPWGITVDSNGDVWIAAAGKSAILRWRSPYFRYSYLPAIHR